MVAPGHDLRRRPAAIVGGVRFPSCERNSRRFDAGLSLVRQCPPSGSSLADPAGHFALSLEAPARATSSRTAAVQFRRQHGLLGSGVRDRVRWPLNGPSAQIILYTLINVLQYRAPD